MSDGADKTSTAEEGGIRHPHDGFARKWFGDPEAAAGMLRAVVPESLKPLMAVENLTLESDSFIDEQLRPSQSDLLWRCQEPGSEDVGAFVYILWEHQSRVDVWMPLRLFSYMGRIWTRWLQHEPQLGEEEVGGSAPRSKRKLPVIFPIVLYQGESEWNAPHSLAELTRGELPGDLKPYFPDFRFWLESIRDRPESSFPPGLAQLGISVLKLMWDEDFLGWMRRMEDQLLELQQTGRGDKLEVLLIYAFTQVDQSRRTEFIENIGRNLSPMITTGKSIYDSLIEEGMEKGREQGLVQGIEEGLEKVRAMVRNMRENGMSIDEISRIAGLENREIERYLSESAPSDGQA